MIDDLPRVGPWRADLTQAERCARLRCMLSIAVLLVDHQSDLVRERGLAEVSATASTRAKLLVDRQLALVRRKIWSTFGVLRRTDPPPRQVLDRPG